ncbi:TetR/AcrR family transcriptional regulator [Geodermatophilus sp. URMC 62]|uniref:TetR/AcrR family transcriptional regulator n=1 Tax=Geodermatophilus sp. URMC 62 TaxID=3423414 RepID=UPI00406C1E1D
MPRPRDVRRREDLLSRALPYLAEHGVADLSLRPLAAALGTSDRMLLHHFGDKESLVGRLLEWSRPDVAALALDEGDVASLAGRLWADLTGGGPQRPRVRILLEVMALALTRAGSYRQYAVAAVRDWVAPIAEALVRDLGEDPASAEARATLLVSGLRGLALDRFVTGDGARTDGAAALLIAAATKRGGVPGPGP